MSKPIDISEKIFKNIDKEVQKSLKLILKDISSRYEVDLEELEIEYLDSTKKKKSGYNKYNSKRRKELLEENPKYDFGEMSKIIGKEWANLTEEEKSAF